MKRRLMLAAMSLILTVTLSVTSMNTVAEASPKMSPTEENLEITINSFLESDGAVAEELTDEMLKTFLETPLDFLRVIDTYPLDKQELLLSRIANVAVGMPDEERLSFEDIIYSADETTPGTALYRASYRLHDTTNLHVGDSEFLLPVTPGQAGSAPAESSIEFRFFRICLALLRVSTQIVKEQSARIAGSVYRLG